MEMITALKDRPPRAAILYHFMYPDDVVSAIHLDGLAQDLANAGWEIEAFPCNRGCRDEPKFIEELIIIIMLSMYGFGDQILFKGLF
jgi:hypothetical protein